MQKIGCNSRQTKKYIYADLGRKEKTFDVGEKVLMKVSHWKGIIRFWEKKNKLNPRYVGSFEILRKVRAVSYQLALPPNLQHITMYSTYLF